MYKRQYLFASVSTLTAFAACYPRRKQAYFPPNALRIAIREGHCVRRTGGVCHHATLLDLQLIEHLFNDRGPLRYASRGFRLRDICPAQTPTAVILTMSIEALRQDIATHRSIVMSLIPIHSAISSYSPIMCRTHPKPKKIMTGNPVGLPRSDKLTVSG